jgi:hypothetical protein
MYNINFLNWSCLEYVVQKQIYANKKITIFVNNIIYSINNYKKSQDEIFIFLQTEPTLLQKEVIDYLIKNYDKFDFILTHDIKLLEYSKSILFIPLKKYFWIKSPINSTLENIFLNNFNITDKFDYNYKNKKFQISMLCGNKRMCKGHRFRIECWLNQNSIKIPKKFYKSKNMSGVATFNNNLETNHKYDKTELFCDSMFHIAIENNCVPNYFTEKLNDCIVSKTIPIYSGCPNIDKYYDINGFILFNSVEELIEKVNNLTPELYYSKLEILEKNYQKFLNHKSFEEQLIDIIDNKLLPTT